MKKKTILSFILLCQFHLSLAQIKSQIDSLLNGVLHVENSRNIVNNKEAQEIISFGEESLFTLAKFFTDTTSTRIRSDCQDRYLIRGEVAIILADQIEFMPYGKLTGIQNCLLSFCENNTNLIEYYLRAIRRDGVNNFQQKYMDWLKSEEYLEYEPLLRRTNEKEREKLKRKKARREKREKRRIKRNKRIQ